MQPEEVSGTHRAPGTERQLSGLIRELGRESEALLRGEAALVRAEIDSKVRQLEQGITSMIVGGAVLFAGLLVLLSAAVFGLGLIMALWKSALIVGAVVTLIAGGLLMVARKKTKTQNLLPSRSMGEVRETAAFAREQVR